MNKLDKILEILQAVKDGKTIEYRHCFYSTLSILNYTEWKEFTANLSRLLVFLSDSDYEFRVSSKEKYRAFRNAEECKQELANHQNGWIIRKDGDEKSVKNIIDIVDVLDLNFIFENYTFIDGHPFGIKIN